MTCTNIKTLIITEVLDNKIKNLEPVLRQTLLTQLLADDRVNSVKSCEKITREHYLKLPVATSRTKSYWMARGWEEVIATVKSKKIAKELNKKNNKKSPYSIEFWLKKINPESGNYYTETEAEFERNARRPIRKEYWIKKGHSELEAVTLANNTKNNNNKKGAIGSKLRTHDQVRVDSHRCIEYWLARGCSLEEANLQLSQSQTVFSKDICIKKHGLVDGVKIWNDRQVAWLSSLKNSGLHGGYSKISNELFDAVKQEIPDIYYGKDECLLQTKTLAYFVDCVRIENKKIIEFYGDYWHANPKKYNECSIIKNTTAEKIWEKDAEKITNLQNSGYSVLIIWESDFRKIKQQVINECINFLIK